MVVSCREKNYCTASFVFSSPESSVFGSDVAFPFLFLFVHSEPGDIVINLLETDNYEQVKSVVRR